MVLFYVYGTFKQHKNLTGMKFHFSLLKIHDIVTVVFITSIPVWRKQGTIVSHPRCK